VSGPTRLLDADPNVSFELDLQRKSIEYFLDLAIDEGRSDRIRLLSDAYRLVAHAIAALDEVEALEEAAA
jgi:hypothetical protein